MRLEIIILYIDICVFTVSEDETVRSFIKKVIK